MRRWIWRALLLAAVMAALTVGAAAEEVVRDGIRYDTTAGTVLGPSNQANITSAQILAKVNESTITTIADNAFSKCTSLKTVDIASGITTIGDHAFSGCSSLETVYFPKSVSTIESFAFSSCGKLNNVILPSQLGEIKQGTFSGCSKLTNIYLPASVKIIGTDAFMLTPQTLILHCEVEGGAFTSNDGGRTETHRALLDPQPVKPAGCVTAGEERLVVSCGTCNRAIIDQSRPIPATGHKPDTVEIPEVPATCVSTGTTAGHKCTVCGKPADGLETIKINPDNHKTPADQHIDIPEVKPTCTEPGSKGGKRCPDCLKVTTQPTVDPAPGHKYNGGLLSDPETVKEATCTEKGLTVQYEVCDVCGDPKECADCERLKEAAQKDPAKLADYETHIKTNHTYTEPDAKGHTPGGDQYVVTKEPTCTTEGMEEWKVICTVCGEPIEDGHTTPPDGQYERDIPATGHTPMRNEIDKDKSKAATCTDAGVTVYKATECRVCHDPILERQEPIKALGHEWKEVDGDDAIIKEATCKEEGQKKVGKKVCTRCKAEEGGTIEPIPRKPHTWESPKADPDKESEDKAPTCGEEGVSHVITTCSVCGETKRQEIKLPATGKHNYEDSEWTTVKNPTATEDGLQERPCMNPGCTHKDSQIIPATGNPSDPDNPDDPNKPTDPEKPKTYSITLVQGAGGTASVSRTTAQEGDRITVTLSPNSGYELDMIRAIGGGTDVLSLTDLGGGQHRFTMPASNVEIRVTFERTNSGSGWATAPGDSSGGSDARRTSDVMPTQNATLGAPQAWATEQRFRDVPVGHWAAGEIEWANQMGYMNGTGGRFNPNGNITNQQMWMILARLTGSNPANMAEARHWAVQGGYADGSSPTGPVKRHQLVTALYRCARLSGSMNRNTTSLAGYNDSRNVPAVARDAFSWALANGIISGSADKNLMPNGYITRAQFAVILYRYSQRV